MKRTRRPGIVEERPDSCVMSSVWPWVTFRGSLKWVLRTEQRAPKSPSVRARSKSTTSRTRRPTPTCSRSLQNATPRLPGRRDGGTMSSEVAWMVQSAANADDRGVRHRNVSLNKHNSTKGSLGQDCPRICFPQNPRSGDRKPWNLFVLVCSGSFLQDLPEHSVIWIHSPDPFVHLSFWNQTFSGAAACTHLGVFETQTWNVVVYVQYINMM